MILADYAERIRYRVRYTLLQLEPALTRGCVVSIGHLQ